MGAHLFYSCQPYTLCSLGPHPTSATPKDERLTATPPYAVQRSMRRPVAAAGSIAVKGVGRVAASAD